MRESGGYSRHGEVDAIIHGSMLSDGRQDGLMVRSRVDGEHPVKARIQSNGQRRRQEAVSIKRSVQALKESKLGVVEGLGIRQAVQLFNDNVRMANGDSLIVELSGSCIIVLLGVGESTGLEIAQLELDGEGLVGGDCAKVEGEDEFGRWNVVTGDDATHRDDVARSRADLLTISERNVLGKAEVDKVVGASQRRNLARGWDLLAVECQVGLDDTGIESK